MDFNPSSTLEHLLISCSIALSIGYRYSLYIFYIGIYIRILFARHYKIKELTKVSLMRMITFGLLLACIGCFVFPVPSLLVFQILFFLLVTLLIDYFLTRITLRSYSKKIIFRFVLFTNLTPLVLIFGFFFIITHLL